MLGLRCQDQLGRIRQLRSIQSGKSGVTFNAISAHSNFAEDIQTERMVDRSGQPDERNSSKCTD